MFGSKYYFCLEKWSELLGSLEPELRESTIRSYEEAIAWGENQSWPQKGLSHDQKQAAKTLEIVIRRARNRGKMLDEMRKENDENYETIDEYNARLKNEQKAKECEFNSNLRIKQDEIARERGDFLKGIFSNTSNPKDDFRID